MILNPLYSVHTLIFLTFPGTADDNVHFQQSMVLTRALVDYNILFRLQVRTEYKTCLNMF